MNDTGYIILARFDPAAGNDSSAWYHVAPPPGEYPSVIRLSGGKKVNGVLVVDDLSLSSILSAFAASAAKPDFPGLLFDDEHLSETGGDTSALAWAKELAQRPDGLWARCELTSLGQTIIGGGIKRFRSPAFTLEKVAGTRDRYRPIALSSIAATNTPHFKELAPSLNRAEEDADMSLDQLRARLKLPATADEAAVHAALETVLAKAESDATALATAQARVVELETADRTREADAFLLANKPRIKDEPAIRALYLKDPESCKALFSATHAAPVQAAAAPRMLGRDAKTPDAAAQAQQASRTAERRRFIAAVRTRDYCSATQALCRAERERPDLFDKTEAAQ